MRFVYKVWLENWSFSELDDGVLVNEFDNPNDAFELHDKLNSRIESDGYAEFYGRKFESVNVTVERG